MTYDFSGNIYYQIFAVLTLVTSVLGALSSLTINWLILTSPQRTGFMLLLLAMTRFQLLYDVTFFPSVVNCGYYATVVANFFQLSCGIAANLVANWIAWVTWFVVTYHKKVSITKRYPLIVFSSLLPGLVDALVYLVSVVPRSAENDSLKQAAVLGLYYYLRLASIAFSLVFCSLSIYKIHLMGSRKEKKSEQEEALRVFTGRLILYPILQALSRSGSAWYEASYGADYDSQDLSAGKFACVVFLAVVTPLVSFGDLCLFLAMQPQARRRFLALFFLSNQPCDSDTVNHAKAEQPSIVSEDERISSVAGPPGLVVLPPDPARDWLRSFSFVQEEEISVDFFEEDSIKEVSVAMTSLEEGREGETVNAMHPAADA